MVVSNVYKYKDNYYIITDVILKVYDTPLYIPPKVDKIELSCIDKDERGKTGKKIYLDPLTFHRCKNIDKTVWKIGEEE